ncbi:MAG: tetratricopeptide repeat protein [Gomphosphaeria aponina SAG 52.96 = DSM 107014]|uniref:Tetratricopeptide repeat protein n=1 Tax=Gomphosphaeria aponina SAG 52.96 = DSM 107014 TaxID=1521640 RepID=A0A941JUQ4_9CHRO|nr:tetratricopeptide repeat protein [Gomphosphaeria aponina SAG 52.96 = DSM 107014]
MMLEEKIEETAAGYIEKGERLGNEGNLNEAAACYRQAIKIEPKEALGYQKLAEVLKQQGDLEGAALYLRLANLRKANEIATEKNLNTEQELGGEANWGSTNDLAQRYLAQGEEYYSKNQWDEAKAACQEALKINPSLADAYKLWGNALVKQGEIDAGIKCYSKALTIKADYVEVYANLGSLHAKQGQWQEAVEYYQTALKYDPKFVGAYRNLEKVWTKLGEKEKAAECRKQLLVLEPKEGTGEEFYHLGEKMWQEGKGKEAIEYYQKAIELKPDSGEAYQKIGEILEQQGAWEEAANYYRQAMIMAGKNQSLLVQEGNQGVTGGGVAEGIRKAGVSQSITKRGGEAEKTKEIVRPGVTKEQQSAEDLVNLGNMHGERGQWGEAIACYQKAIMINPKFAAAFRNLARVLTHTGQTEKAADYWYQALSLEPNWAKAEEHLNLGKTLEKQGKLEQALNCYRRAIQLEPSLAEAYLQLGELLAKQGKEGAAVSCWRQGLVESPASPELNYRVALALTAQKQWEEAISYYEKTIALQPNYWEAYHNLGNALQEQQRWREAVGAYQQVIKLKPEFSWAYNNMGDALRELQLWEEAAKAFRETTRLNPEFPWAHYNLGDVLGELGDVDGAIAAYTQALVVQTDFPQAEEKLNQTLLQRIKSGFRIALEYYQQQIQQDPTDIESYERAVQIEPDNFDLVLGLGNALMEEERLSEAVGVMEKAVALKPDFGLGYQHLANMLRELGDEEKATDYWFQTLSLESEWGSAADYLALGNKLREQEKLGRAVICYRRVLELENTPEAEVYLSLGAVLREQQEWKAAIEVYQKGLELHLQNPELYYHLGETWASRGQWEKAVKCYKQAVKYNRNYWQAYEQWGAALAQLEQWEQAVIVMERSLQLNQEISANSYHNLGTALCHLQRWEEAYKNYQKVGQVEPDFWEVKDKKLPEEILDYLEQLLPDGWGEIFPLVLGVGSNGELGKSPKFRQFCRHLQESIKANKLTLTYGKWLTPSIIYLECKVQNCWVFGEAKVLGVADNNCGVGVANFFQISPEEIAAAIIFSRPIYTMEGDAYSLTVWWNNLPVLIEGILGEKAYGLEFVQRINQMSEHQKHLIRDKFNRALVELTPQQIKQEAGELLNKIQYYVQEVPITPIDYNLPFNIFIDQVIPVEWEGLFIAGWMQDPYGLLEEIEAISSLGFSLVFREKIYFYERRDVNEHIQNTRYGKFEGKLGFCTYEQIEPEIRKKIKDFVQLHGWRFKIKLKGGVMIENTPDLKYHEVSWARELLVKLVPVPQVSDEMLDNCLGPAAYKLQELCMEQVRAKEVKVIGEPVENPLVSLVIPLYKRLDFLKVQFATMANDPTIKEQCELIYVLDSPEQEEELKDFLLDHCALYELPVTLVVMQRNSGYAAATNTGAAQARGNYIVLLNSDVFPKTKGWAVKMAEFYAAAPKIGALAPKLIYEDQSLQHAGMFFSKTKFPFWITLHYYKGFPNSYAQAQISRAVPAVTGACLMMSKELYEEVGGLSTDYVIGDFEDSDLCLKCAKLGYESWYYADAELYHLERQSVPLNSVYVDSLAWRYNARLHTRRWGNLIEELMNGE